MIWPTSGEPTLTDEQVVKTFDYFGQLAENKSVDPAFFVNITDDFAQDRVSMIIAGIWALPAIRAVNPDAKIAVAPLPVWGRGRAQHDSLFLVVVRRRPRVVQRRSRPRPGS